MRTPGFHARRWLNLNRDEWFEWLSGPGTERLERMDRLSHAVMSMTCDLIGHDGAAELVAALPATLGRCNELAFDTDVETLAYSVWHLVERYVRVIEILDDLVRSGDLPLRKTRLTALEVGAGPMPALHAVRDFYADLAKWSQARSGAASIVGATHLYTLDRSPGWRRFNHCVGERLMHLGDQEGPHKFATDFLDFQSFSVREAHSGAIERAATQLYTEALEWGESRLTLGEARSQVGSSHSGPPGAIDLIIVCNFLTETSMTTQFESEIAELARSLTPGGVLMMIGSASDDYDEIFDSLDAIFQRARTVKRLTPRRQLVRVHSNLRERVTQALATILRTIEAGDSGAFDSVRDQLPRDVRHPGSTPINLPRFRLALYKNEHPGVLTGRARRMVRFA